MVKLVFEPNCEHAVTVVEDGNGYDFPVGSDSMFLPRYILVEGRVVDRYPGMDEDEARVAFIQLIADREAAALEAEEEEGRRERAVLTRLEYLRRFTQAERIAIASAEDPIVKDFMTMVQMAEHVDLNDPDTIAGTRFIEGEGSIATGRADEILTIV